MRSRWKQTAGFSLLELLLVVLIMAVAAGLAMPMVGQWLGRGDPEQTAWRLRSALSLMRVYAVQRAQAQVFVVDPNSNAYRHDGKVVEVASPGRCIVGCWPVAWRRRRGGVSFLSGRDKFRRRNSD